MDRINVANIEHSLEIESFLKEMWILNYYIPEETSLDINVPAASISITDISLKANYYDIQKDWLLESSDYGFCKFYWRVSTAEPIGQVSPLAYLKPNTGLAAQHGDFGRFWIKQGMVRLYLENTHPTEAQSVRANIKHLYIEQYQFKEIIIPLLLAKRAELEARAFEITTGKYIPPTFPLMATGIPGYSLPSKIVPDYECCICHNRAHIDLENGKIAFRNIQDQLAFEGKGGYMGGAGHTCPLLIATTEAELIEFKNQGVIKKL